MTIGLRILMSILFITKEKIVMEAITCPQHFYFILGRFMLVDYFN